MRPVRGFDRAIVQWTFVALAVVLIVLAAALAVAVRGLNVTVGEMHAARIEERAARDQLEARLARERSTREALALELGRLRAGQANASAGASGIPTLTLRPLRAREATPPPPTMSAPAASQIIELRLVLPPGADAKLAPFSLTVRDWTTGQDRLTRGGLGVVAFEGGSAVAAFVTGDIFPSGAHEVILRTAQAETATYEITVK
jgi:hypothetical protein